MCSIIVQPPMRGTNTLELLNVVSCERPSAQPHTITQQHRLGAHVRRKIQRTVEQLEED